MAKEARIGAADGKIVKAKDVTIAQKDEPFFCATEGCGARMTLVSCLTDSAHFRSRHIKDHKFGKCIPRTMEFDSSRYSEESFSLENAVRYIVGKEDPLNIHLGTGKRRARQQLDTLGGYQKMPIRTLKTLYLQCLETGIGGTYGGVKIGDILASRNNFSYYSSGIAGFKIVEATYYKKVYGQPCIYFNYPSFKRDGNPLVRMNFQNHEVAFEYAKKLKGNVRTDLIVLAGIWKKSSDPNCIAECDFRKKTQIAVISDD